MTTGYTALLDFVLDERHGGFITLVHVECSAVVGEFAAPVGLDEVVASANDHECPDE